MTDFSVTVDTSSHASVVVVHVVGELDAHTFPTFQAQLDDLLHHRRAAIVIDCTQLRYISSAGLGVLKQKTFDTRELGGDVRLANMPKKVHAIMDLLGFTKLLKVFPTVEAAAASFSSH